MTGSLRRRLVLSLSCVMLTAWIATAAFTYFDTRQLIDEVTDAHLEQSAEMLLRLLDRLAAPGRETPEGVMLETDPGQQFSFRISAGPRAQDRAEPADTGEAAPDVAPGPRDMVRDGEGWRIFAATDGRGRRVEVAIRQDVRGSFAARVAAHLLHPLWIAIPLLAALIWATVRWGLGPLEKVAASVANRSASHLHPLRSGNAPTEILPLVSALNDLFARIAASRERDRRFAADAAHELRTPLAAIKAHAQVAERATDLQHCKQSIGDVLAGVERGTRVVEQLLALARIDRAASALDFVPVDLRAIVQKVIIELAPKAVSRDIDLGLSSPQEPGAMVDGNADLIAVLVRNLVDNALRYTPQRGQVSVAVGQEGEAITLRVEDTGPGIAPELRTRVVDRFFRVAGTGVEGSGLGLSIVSAIADAHGATFTLEDRANAPGLCARVAFPTPKLRHSRNL